MFAPAGLVVARSVQVHGAISPWQVLVWLGLMAGCLLLISAITALTQFAATRLRSSAHRRAQGRRGSEV